MGKTTMADYDLKLLMYAFLSIKKKERKRKKQEILIGQTGEIVS